MTRAGETKNLLWRKTSIRDEFDIDRRLTVSALATMVYVSIWTVFTILTEYLNMSNVHVPRSDVAEEQWKGEACERFEIVFKTLMKKNAH